METNENNLGFLCDIIKNRRSIRRFKIDKVNEQLLMQAIEMATWAPSAGNKQNWYFYIIVNQTIISEIAKLYQTAFAQIGSWPESKLFSSSEEWLKDVSFFRNAPAAIAVATTKYESSADQILAAREKSDPGVRKIRLWRNTANSAIQSIGSTIAYLLLALFQMGLGATWMTGPMLAKGDIEKILNIPADRNLVAFIPVGYPDEKPDAKKRRPISEVCEVIR